jgi:prepilin-type N-terminal cleavage/methylation domain-containing protein
MNSSQTFYRGRAAFTLVELLAAMAVLALIVLMIGNVLSTSTKAYAAGSARAEHNMNGRTVIDFIALEVNTAIVNPTLPFRVRAGSPAYGLPTHQLTFAALGPSSQSERDEVHLIQYQIMANPLLPGTFQLVRGDRHSTAQIKNAYQSITWANSIFADKPIVDNVTTFNVLVNGVNTPTWDSHGVSVRTNLPAYVDLFIGLLSSEDAQKINYVSDKLAFLAKNEKRFYRRIQCIHRLGYESVQ